MARQPRRSASVLTRKSRSRSVHPPAITTLSIQPRFLPLLTLALTILIGISRAQSNLDSDLKYTQPPAQPKFGDRLQPRNRQLPSFNSSTSSVNNRNLDIRYSHPGSNELSASNGLNAPSNQFVAVIKAAVTTDGSEVANHFDDDRLNASSRGQVAPLRRRNDDDIEEAAVGVVSALEVINETGGRNRVAPTATHLNTSKADRLIEMSTEFFIVPSSTTTERPLAAATTSKFNTVGEKNNHLQPRPVAPKAPKDPSKTHNNASSSSSSSSSSPITPPSIVSTHLPKGLRKEPWVVPVLVLASLTMIMMAAFEIFVLFKAWRTSPSRRHLFLGQMLLLGLFACAGLGAIITAQPTVLSCGAIRFGAGVAYALVFAALLVKCVFLISLNGGVYLPAPYQGLLLLFAVLIQVAIGTQWLMTQPPDIYTMTVPYGGGGVVSSSSAAGTGAGIVVGGATSAGTSVGRLSSMLITSSDITRLQHSSTVLIPLCKTQFSELLLSLIYIVFLIVFVAVLAIKSRGIRDNYRESTYIGLAIGGAIPIWLGWMLCGLAVADRHKDACIAFGLVATSATVFLVMFMPKGRQLAAMGKEGLYVEDREEQFSSLSRAGSGYSPSFFHFKPIKYGVMGPVPNSTSNTGNVNSSKHTATMNGGDRVALVTAAPPSYTRMYHYFPAHLTHPFCFYPQPPPPQLSQPLPPTLKAIGSSITSMTPAHLAQTLRYPGLFIRPDETNLYTTLEPTLSSNPNVYFQRSGGVHPGMMY